MLQNESNQWETMLQNENNQLETMLQNDSNLWETMLQNESFRLAMLSPFTVDDLHLRWLLVT